MHSTKLPPARLAWTVWGLGAALYIIGFFQRVAPGVMTAELMSEFTLGAAALGNLSAFYFYSYVAMQIPTGLLADSWGPRRLLTAGAAVAGVGSLCFALADGLFWACAGRLLIGGSVAVAFVAMMKLSSLWMAPRQFALASGMALFLGILGAVFAGTPLRLLVVAYSWRPVMLAASVLPLLVAVAIWIIVRDDPGERGYASYAPKAPSGTPRTGIIEGLRQVFSYRNTWLLLFAPGAVAGSILTFAGLWGVPFLTTHYGLGAPEAAALCSTLLLAWAVGGPVCGGLSDRIGLRKPLYVAGCAVLTAGWAVVILVPALPYAVLVALLIVIGFAAGCMIIGFAFAKESVPAHLAGTAAGVCNMGSMLGPMLLQPAVGWMLDRKWQGAMAGGARIYELSAFRTGFSLMLVWAVLALVCVALTRETGCRQMQ
ncbi:MFS transporter [Desulfuromonas versatilis]|uniref:Lysosomal dipeptide transporter MFSD1 n=1 Tax=Desulfuromonas versatilis TaxID=2802975 RepID=A0ABN6DXI2_9BACT|nr:MFS transporter [Desulfuromonas versatilis]BCR04239.1 MFS transporter [Desulfuromonas versatilis]